MIVGSSPGPSTAPTPLQRRLGRWLATAAMIVALAAVLAVPWLWQQWFAFEIIGVATLLALSVGRSGWQGETQILVVLAVALAGAFHWAPVLLAGAMQAHWSLGVLAAAPLVLWDAARMSLPFWCVARIVRDPRDAWLPAALAAVAAEAVVPGVFPWKIGYSQIGWPLAIQAADLFGPETPSFVLFAHSGVLVAVVAAAVLWRRGVRGMARLFTPTGIAAIAVMAANAAYSGWALGHHARLVEAAPKIDVALVQVDPGEEGATDTLRRLTREAAADRGRPFDLVCWPECTGGCYHQDLRSFRDEAALTELSRDPNPGMRPLEGADCPLLLGGRIYTGLSEKPLELYQAAILIDPREDIVGHYRKRHLMPFGEYVLGADAVPELRSVFPLNEELDAGQEATVLAVDGTTRLGVMLCYEEMIPSTARSLVEQSATLLVTLINGAVFPDPLTLAQQRLLAQLRAVENRRCLLRCASTGETCIVSPLGTVAAAIPVKTQQVLVATVPLLEGRTLASRIGFAFPAVCAAALAILCLRRRLRQAGS